MYTLTDDEILAFVRKSLDELVDNGSLMYDEDMDNESLKTIVRSSIVEAVVSVHSQAPAERLQGKIAETDEYSKTIISDMLQVSMKTDVIRVLSVRVDDSPFVATAIFEEDSPEGRMQQNPYTKGTYDKPVVILKRGTGSGYRPVLCYYSLKDIPDPEKETVPSIEYIPLPAKNAASYEVSEDLRFAVLNTIVGLVLTSYKEPDQAGIFYQRAAQTMK